MAARRSGSGPGGCAVRIDHASGYAAAVVERAAAGLATTSGERHAVSWLDAEDATTRRALS